MLPAIFTALYLCESVLSMSEISDRPSVRACLSVRLSAWQTRELWQSGRYLCPHSYATWKNVYPSFL